MNADALYRWAQALALIATMSTTWFAIVRFMREDRLVKRQMERMGQLEKVLSIAPDDLADHIHRLQREVVADYLATVISGSWNRIGIAKLPLAGTATAVSMFSILTGILVANNAIDLGLRNAGILIPVSLIVGPSVAWIVGWFALGPLLGRHLLREELHRRFIRHARIEGAVEDLDLSSGLRRKVSVMGAVWAIIMYLGLTAGTVTALSLIAGAVQSALTMASVVTTLMAGALSLAFLVFVSNGPERYGEIAMSRRHP